MAGCPDIAKAADGDSLTWHGLTVYGAFDVGIAYQTHGTPLSKDFYPGLEYLISKNSNRPITSVAPNGLSQSLIGLRGVEEIRDGWSFVFNLESGFVPTSGHLADALKAVAHNNGAALDAQAAGSDGSRAGQIFNGQAYGGLSSPRWGSLTYGRQNTPLRDAIVKYDPMGGSYAFSVIGYSGTTAGMGDTQDARLDDSLVYAYKRQRFHLAALYQFGKSGSRGTAGQFDVGGDFGGFSIDGIYSFRNRGISATSLSAAQAAVLPSGSLAATVSDVSSYTLAASYTRDAWKVSAGYERMVYENPSEPITRPFSGLGGYYFSVVSNTAYTHHKVLKVSWIGLKYAVTPQLDVAGAWYHAAQNSYSGNGCSDASLASCSGTLDAFSLMVDYRFTKRFDMYAGAMYSTVSDGYASGYLFTSTVDPMIGFRYRF